MRRRTALLLLAALLGCADERPDPRAALLRADSAFARETAAGGAEAWASWFAEDGAMVRGDGEIVGRADIREAMTPALSDTTVRFTWAPDRAIAAEGPLGATIGTYQITRAADGALLERGRYLTLWRRQSDGSWKVSADIGAPAPGPGGPEPGAAAPAGGSPAGPGPGS